jgi:hypothetical protein
MNAISVKATGQEIRREISDFDIERWASFFAEAVIEQEHAHEQEQDLTRRISAQKITAPHAR